MRREKRNVDGIEPMWYKSQVRKILVRSLKDLRGGEIRLREGSRVLQLGTGGELKCEIAVLNPRFYGRALWGGSLGAAESYLDGEWECDDLTALFRIVLRNRNFSRRMGSLWSKLLHLPSRWWHRLRSNTRAGSQKNIHEHYDLGNDFFSLMLDETWAYSSGIFLEEGSSLLEASEEKIDRACRKLELNPGDHLLEIGTGWGSLAVHAATQYGCRVTTATISREQYDFARRRIEREGLSEQVEVLLTDYRDLQGTYDKLVSIEMIEAVGHEYLGDYFEHCSRLLSDEGTLLIQGILMSEQDHTEYVNSVDFIQRYIFPGGCLPSVASISKVVATRSDLRWVHFEDFGVHYGRTLQEWRDRFEREIERVRGLGYSERFIRMWRYYLCYCEAAFEERYIGVAQLMWDKPGCRRDPIRLSREAARNCPALKSPPKREWKNQVEGCGAVIAK